MKSLKCPKKQKLQVFPLPALISENKQNLSQALKLALLLQLNICMQIEQHYLFVSKHKPCFESTRQRLHQDRRCSAKRSWWTKIPC